MDKRVQGRGKGQPTPSSSKSERTMTTRYRRKKEEEKSSRKEERSKRLRLYMDHQGDVNNDLVLTGQEGAMRVKLERDEQQVKVEQDPGSLEVETGSGQGIGDLQAPQLAVKLESPETNEIVVTEEVDIPNDDDQEEELVDDSNLLVVKSEADNDVLSSSVVPHFRAVGGKKEELKKLLKERDLEIKRLRDENKQLKLSSLANRQVSFAAIRAQCTTEDLLASANTRIEALEVENLDLRTLLARKDAENGAHCERTSQVEEGIARGIGTLSRDRTSLETATRMNDVTKDDGIQTQQLNKALGARPPLGTLEEKVLQLFPDVLKIIIQNEAKVKNSVHWRKLMPFLTACRPVCKSWKESVDLIMQLDSSHFDLGHIYRNLSDHKKDFTPCPLRISYDAFDNARWTAEFERIRCQLRVNRSYNPIPSRHLMLSGSLPGHLSSENSEKWAIYCQMVTAFLQQAGQQVWYLTVDFSGRKKLNKGDVMVVCKCLSDWFSLLPNLRSLSLATKFGKVKALGDISFSKFENLEALAFEGSQWNHLYYTIMNNNRHVKWLALAPHSVTLPIWRKLDLPNLSTLKCAFSTPEDWQQFVNSAPWKMQNLSVQFFDNYGDKRRPTEAQFARGVAKFGSMLKSLTFDPSEFGDRTGKDLELDLPHLKSLRFACRDWFVFPPEVRMASLQSLESYSMELSVAPGVQVQSQFFSKMIRLGSCDKADWMKLPKLRNVKISVKVNGMDIGEPDLIVKRRQNMPSVIFSAPKINSN